MNTAPVIHIPSKALVAIAYSPKNGIRELASCLINQKPFAGQIHYRGQLLPNKSVPVTFLGQECLDSLEQLDRIYAAAKAGARLVLISHMAEGLSPDAEEHLHNSVQQLCCEFDVTVINEEYNPSALHRYEYSIVLGQ